MTRSWLGKSLLISVVVVAAFAIVRAVRGQSVPAFELPGVWPTLRPEAPAPIKAWIDATGGLPPASHPIKAKLGSGIFHLPGMMNYERTRADRFYRNAADAEADGLRAAKR